MEKMLEEVEYCKAVIKKHFNKPLVMTKVDEQHFKTMDGPGSVLEKELTGGLGLFFWV